MVATALTVTTTSAAGVVVPAASSIDNGNGNSFANTGRELIQITNASGGSITITFITQGVYTAVGGTTYNIADLAVSLANATTRAYGPFDKTLFNDANALVQITWSAGGAITANVISLGTG